MKRIAPNNRLPATHFVQVWKGEQCVHYCSPKHISVLHSNVTKVLKYGSFKTIAVFHIRENKLPTNHKF